jgi:hypothetical protein
MEHRDRTEAVRTCRDALGGHAVTGPASAGVLGPPGRGRWGEFTMRPVRIIATAAVVAALAVTGCSSRSADQTAAPSSSAPTTQPTTTATTRTTAGTAGTMTTTLASPPRRPAPCPRPGTGRGSGHPVLPRVRALRRRRGDLRGDRAGHGQGHRQWSGDGRLRRAGRFCRVHDPGTQGHLPGQGPPQRHGRVGHLHGERLTSHHAEQRPKRCTSGESRFVTPARTTGKGLLRQGRTKPERRCLGCRSSEVVVELDLPAPLAVVPGMPPALEDASLSAG